MARQQAALPLASRWWGHPVGHDDEHDAALSPSWVRATIATAAPVLALGTAGRCRAQRSVFGLYRTRERRRLFLGERGWHRFGWKGGGSSRMGILLAAAMFAFVIDKVVHERVDFGGLARPRYDGEWRPDVMK